MRKKYSHDCFAKDIKQNDHRRLLYHRCKHFCDTVSHSCLRCRRCTPEGKTRYTVKCMSCKIPCDDVAHPVLQRTRNATFITRMEPLFVRKLCHLATEIVFVPFPWSLVSTSGSWHCLLLAAYYMHSGVV